MDGAPKKEEKKNKIWCHCGIFGQKKLAVIRVMYMHVP